MKKFTILIVDDQVSNLKILVDYLDEAQQGYKVLSVSDPRLALKIMQEKELDLVLTDWQMPQLSGLDLIQLYKQNHPHKKLPFMIVTGTYTTAEELKLAMDKGALDFIRKPINKVELWARVSSLLNLFYAYKIIDHQKDEALSQKTLAIHQNNQTLQQIQKDLEKYALELPVIKRIKIKTILQKFPQANSFDQEWETFKKQFEEIHPYFFKTLENQFQALRPHELRMCAYIRVGFSIKEISELLHIERRGARVKKTRIKKKMNLPDQISLDEFLMKI